MSSVTIRSISDRRSGVVPPWMSWAYMWGSLSFVRGVMGGEERAEVDGLGLEHGPAVGVEPVGPRAVEVELDAVAVGIGQVDGDRAAVVAGAVDREAVIEQALDGAAQLVPVRVEEGDVVEAGVARRGRRRSGALPRVDRDVVVVVAGREEGGGESRLAPVGGHAEAEPVAV